ncbi:WhiB family transcriptional regulator [Micromonospora sp. CB01531]|uniref:WhiB family transcriptional regulator n=1 Tax=Micromonospora sp. CB01531 TaxID=1718947 RepID=UPI00094003C8
MSQQAAPGRTDWWRYAACVSWDSEWWTDSGPHCSRAVRICLACPVREPCLADALANGDVGVIRGGVLLQRRRQGTEVVQLICVQCGSPVRFTDTTVSRYCGRQCESKARRRAARRRRGLAGAPHADDLPVTGGSPTSAVP